MTHPRSALFLPPPNGRSPQGRSLVGLWVSSPRMRSAELDAGAHSPAPCLDPSTHHSPQAPTFSPGCGSSSPTRPSGHPLPGQPLPSPRTCRGGASARRSVGGPHLRPGRPPGSQAPALFPHTHTCSRSWPKCAPRVLWEKGTPPRPPGTFSPPAARPQPCWVRVSQDTISALGTAPKRPVSKHQ